MSREQLQAFLGNMVDDDGGEEEENEEEEVFIHFCIHMSVNRYV
jgi:hypothetical protein